VQFDGLSTRARVLVCVDHFAHWIVIVRATASQSLIVDSSRWGDLHQRTTWRWLPLAPGLWPAGGIRISPLPTLTRMKRRKKTMRKILAVAILLSLDACFPWKGGTDPTTQRT